MRLLSTLNSLAFRVALVLFFTLSAAQAVNFYLFSEKRREDLIQEASFNAIERFVERVAESDRIRFEPSINSRPGRPGRREDGRRPKPNRSRLPPERPLNPNGRLYKSTEAIPIPSSPSFNPSISEQLSSALIQNNIEALNWAASYSIAPEQGPLGRNRERRQQPIDQVSNNRIRPDEIRLSVKLKGSSYWINSIYPVKPLPVKLSFSDFIESASIFVFFLTIAIALIVYSLVRPLKGLSKATVKVGQREDNALLPVEGPNEIRQVTQSFNQMSRRVNELLREKDAMLGALGHDLRTPLTSLRLRVDKMTPVETREDVINTLDETAKLIDDILEFARSVGDRGTMSDYDITSILYDVVADYQDMQTDVTLIDAPRIVAPCKPAAIKRMMRDLIENALKYAGSAQVSISTYDNCVTIKVEDEGPGVEEAMFDSLLQPFKRGEDSRSRSTGGTGLGLAIAKSVANAHGGDVMLMNRKPKGLCVIASILL